MKMIKILSLVFVLSFVTSCKSEAQKQKEQTINRSVETMKTTMDSMQNHEHVTTDQTMRTKKSKSKDDGQADKIIGVWEVKNDYYMAIYEVEKYQGKYVGKVHYYNDGKTEYKGKNTKEDYFLSDVVFENGVYKNGNMFMPDGTNYQVVFKLKGEDKLEAKMTVEGSPYTEIWKRSSNF